MRIRNLYPGSFGANCYLLISGAHAAIVDPSAPAQEIAQVLEQEQAKAEYILLTHGHFDHIISIDTLRDLLKIPVWIHEAEVSFPADSEKNGFSKFFHMQRTYRAPEKAFQNGDVFRLGNEEIRVIHTPGHTPGSVCFALPENRILTGDTLFDGDRGRTDLYGGNEEQIRLSLQNMKKWEPTALIYPGHGNSARLADALNGVID